MSLTLQVRRLPHGEGLELPAYETGGAAGLDLRAAVSDDVVMQPGSHATVPTGLAVALPAGHEGQIRPRSGLAHRHGVTVLNGPGTIDADYRGEIHVRSSTWGTGPSPSCAANASPRWWSHRSSGSP
jgi:dUTP pyrophosphatase